MRALRSLYHYVSRYFVTGLIAVSISTPYAIAGPRVVVPVNDADLARASTSRAMSTVGPPNLVSIESRLVTAGQPSAAWLSTLKTQGYDAVINLTPIDAPEAPPNEAAIVTRQGVRFIRIPIKTNKPVKADFDRFVSAMNALDDKKVLVHCQINQRSSSMVFLYRTIVRKEDPQAASEALIRAGVPTGVWKDFIDDRLNDAGIAFELF
jgi:protein tyrosine phosphatase (PTP) superfamily phosphohydrolase (DUF442 family)